MSSNYQEIIEFVNKVGAPKRQKAIRVSDDLCVGYASPYPNPDPNAPPRFRIFSITSGRPVVTLDFSNMDDAKDYAKRLDETYKDFWFLLHDYPKMDIPQVCMWTVPNGIRIYETIVSLSSLENQDTITLTDLKRAYDAAQYKVDDYMKFP